MGNYQIIQRTEEYIRSVFEKEGSGHDWWHMHRVREAAMYIGKREGADLFLTEMLALLHDLDDWKFAEANDETLSRTKKWLYELGLDTSQVDLLEEMIGQISFKGAGEPDMPARIEAKVVQDADRLDAIGAMGIARAFAYGGSKGRMIYDPEAQPALHQTFDEYKRSNSSSVNHFYEKLLLLKDRMNTETGKQLAEKRHTIMVNFLSEFFDEWNCIY